MPSQRRKDIVGQRRRVNDDGDDEGSILTEAVDDSQSEASVPTDAEDEADAEFSDVSEPNLRGAVRRHSRAASGVNSKNQQRSASVPGRGSERASSQGRRFEVSKDTEAMLGGLSIADGSKDDALDYESLQEGAQDVQEPAASKNATPAERRKQEHEEYKQKRDADPAFIPTRGAFFMHDQRTAANGYRPFGRGRGRGRGGSVGPYAPGSHAPNEPSSSQWSHDLHESLLEPAPKSVANTGPPAGAPSGPANAFAGSAPAGPSAIVRSFSTTQVLGKLQIRVALPRMKDPITYSDVTVKRYTKLPNHRPPLRRDKPVRLSLPEHPVRYIFPSMERSFIFIPRALRPNQQGFGRGRGRGISSLGGFSSRRTSIYNGSMYSPSVAMSRRSSIARDGMASPVSMLSVARPVVRLPPGAHHQHTASGTPIHSAGISAAGTPAFGMPPPQKPQYRENWPMNIQMHQPRPQKPIPVHGFEHPAAQMGATGFAEQQPFHHQVPVPSNGTGPEYGPYAHGRQSSSYSIQPTGTPLSNIPERAIHAQPFQPYQQGGYPSPYSQPAYYHPAGVPAPGQYTPGAVVAPMYVQSPQQGGFIAPTIATAGPPAVQHPPAPNGLVAYEQNGMVYYYDPSQVSNQYWDPQQAQQGEYPQQAYQPQMAEAVNPAEGYYYGPPQVQNGTIYYQQ